MVSSLIIFFCSFYPTNINCQQELSQCIEKEIRIREDISTTAYNEQWVFDAFQECTKNR